jgi:hypothetical protein
MAMIQALFYAEAPVIATVVCATTAASAVLAHVLASRFRPFAAVRGRPVVASYFSATTTLFTLFLAFSASHAWTNDNAARAAAAAESAAADRLLTIIARFHPAPAEAAAPVKAYIAAVVQQEWGADRNRAVSPAAVAALDAMEAMVWDARIQRHMDTAVADAMLRAVDALETARTKRLGLAADVGDGVRWMLLLLLGFVALLSMAMCHADRPETSRIAVGVLALAMAAVMSVSAMYESPYTGLHAIGPDALARLLVEHRALALPNR